MTQKSRVLAMLKRNRAVTTIALVRDGVLRGSERIRELIADGHDISRERCELVNRYGEVVRVARYRLIKAAA